MFTRVFLRVLAHSAMLVMFVGGTALQATVAGELEQQFQTTLKRAQAGDVQAMYALGETYELGMGTDSSRTEALKWYQAAADKGHAEGAYQVGYAYYWGKGVSKDRGQAFTWFQRAAEGGSQAAMPYLSKMYALGQGVPQDKAKAAEWGARAGTTASNLYAQPPAPEVTRNAVVEEKAAPASEPAVAPPAREKPAETSPSPARVTAKPAVTAKPKVASTPPGQRTIQRLLAADWRKGSRPALYLPSSETQCQAQGGQLNCESEARRSSLLGRPYAFRLVATLSDFTDKGGFSLSYQPQVTGVLQAGPGGYAADVSGDPISEEDLRKRVERAPEQLTCEMQDAKTLNCTDSKGQTQVYNGVEPSKEPTALSKPPSGNEQTRVAAQPSPPPQQEAPEEFRRSRIAGRRP